MVASESFVMKIIIASSYLRNHVDQVDVDAIIVLLVQGEYFKHYYFLSPSHCSDETRSMKVDCFYGKWSILGTLACQNSTEYSNC